MTTRVRDTWAGLRAAALPVARLLAAVAAPVTAQCDITRLIDPTRWRRAVVLVALAAATGCAGAQRYAHDRLLDLTDVVDLKYGRAMGLGAKIEATLFLGAGLGYAELGPTTEWFGRSAHTSDEGGGFLHVLLFGWEGRSAHGGDLPSDAVLLFGVNAYAVGALTAPGRGGYGPEAGQFPLIEAFRIGGELVLPFVHGGLSLNLGEVLDFVAGLATLDPAGDDGLPKAAARHAERAPEAVNPPDA